MSDALIQTADEAQARRDKVARMLHDAMVVAGVFPKYPVNDKLGNPSSWELLSRSARNMLATAAVLFVEGARRDAAVFEFLNLRSI